MGHNSGKRKHRGKHFVAPTLQAIKGHQHFGIITKYHGGASRNMTLSIMDGGHLKEVKATLKGSLRHMKCKQRIIVGQYVILEYDQVIIIMTPSQSLAIPRATQIALATTVPESRWRDDEEQIEFENQQSSDDDTDYQVDNVAISDVNVNANVGVGVDIDSI